MSDGVVENISLPKNWQVKTLDDLCEIARGGSPRPIKDFLTGAEDGVNWIKIGDATASTKYIYKTKQKIKPEGIQRSRLVRDGDFILSNSMSFGRPYIMKITGCIHDGWLVLRDKSGLFDQDFLYLFLSSTAAYKQFDNLAAGSTVRTLNIDLVKKVQVSFPPLPEQKRIVTILDEVFSSITQAVINAEKNLINARELFESYLNNVFTQKGEGWVEDKIEAVSTVINGYSFKSTDFATDNEIKSIKITNVGVKKFVKTSGNNLPTEFQEELSNYIIHEGNIVIALTRTIIAEGLKVAIVPREYNGSLLNQRVAALISKEDIIDNDFLYYFLGTKFVKDYVLSNVNTLMQPNLSLTDLKRLLIVHPSLKEQQILVREINALSKEVKELESIYQQKLNALSELKQSILQKAFSGELTSDDIPKQANG